MSTLDDLERVERELPLLHNGRPALLEQLHAHAATIRNFIAAQREREAILFDGYRVYCALADHARLRTGAENVADTLHAVVNLMRLPEPPKENTNG